MESLPTPPDSASEPLLQIAEVRYSLPDLLKELSMERTTGSFAMEKLNQVEIAKAFKAKKAKRRA